jgi:hypothetical protein
MRLRFVFLLAVITLGTVAFMAFWQAHQPVAAPLIARPAPLADLSKVSPEDLDRLVNVSLQPKATPAELIAAVAEKLKKRVERADARPREAVLTFKSAEAYHNFLVRAGLAGLRIIGRIDSSNTARVGYDSLNGLARELLENGTDYDQVAANFFIGNPNTPPQAQTRANRTQVAVGNNLLPVLGVSGDTQTWGHGVTIAVLDSGVAADATFGLGRLSTLDVGLGTAAAGGAEGGHGTAVAALAAGQASDAPGVAPAANILSVRVTGDDGKSDAFTVAQGILAAVDAGAKIVNISLGGYGTNAALDSAIDYATSHGAVIVAAAGNDQAAQLTWPAADPRVISVGAVDATGQQAIFSNSGPQLQITAPGLGLQTAWTDGARVNFDGTSGSSPIVAGAIAAIMSQDSSLTPAQAWQVLQTHASEAGVPGPDPNYGNGVLNLGWAMARNDPTRIDTAIASQYYDASTEQMQIVVQNRSAQAVAGLDLNVNINGAPQHYPIAWLAAGATSVVSLPISAGQLAAAGRIEFNTDLVNASGITDQVPTNNHRASVLTSAAKSTH